MSASDPGMLFEVFTAALRVAGPERDEFLRRRCAGDGRLLEEVRTLLEHHAGSEDFLEPTRGGVGLAAEQSGGPGDSLTGRVIGPFAVGERIGRGGMGVVYAARDTRLERTVALKVVPDGLGADPERRARLQREARAMAALNHPHVAAIHTVEELIAGSGLWVLVLEFVPGQTLAERLARGPMPLDEALSLARQVAGAVDAAHARGIIHRDLKPGNIKITPEGAAKVLDFGVARAIFGMEADAERTRADGQTPTGAVITRGGPFLGTPAYMSPEQARGRPVDRRADLWAFGCIVYEMLTGTRAFPGESVSETIAAVLRAEPDWSKLPRSAGVERMLRRCLEKDPDRRLRDAGDARLELDDAIAALGTEPDAPRRVGALALVVGAAAMLGLGVWAGTAMFRRAPAGAAAPTRFAVELPEPGALAADWLGGCMTLSPDGRALVYSATRDGGPERLYLRPLDAFEATELPGTVHGYGPCFSPDGRWVAYADFTGPEGVDLRRVPVAGGLPSLVCRASNADKGIAWLEGDTIVFTGESGGLARVNAAGGEPEAVTTPVAERGEVYHTQASALKGAVLFTCLRREGEQLRLSVEAVRLADRERRVVVPDACQARLVAPGYLVYFQAGSLMAAPFDKGALRVTGEARKALAPLAGAEAVPVPRYAVSQAGTLAYLPSPVVYSATDLAWFGADGSITTVFRGNGAVDSLRLSRDGGRVAVAAGAASPDIWVQDLSRDAPVRLTTGGDRYFPVWTPDGTRVAFRSVLPDRSHRIEWVSADGGSAPQTLLALPAPATGYANDFTPDGSELAVSIRQEPEGHDDVYLIRPGEPGPARRLFGAPAAWNRFGARFSPDGTMIAYTSRESGRIEVYLQPYPALDRKIAVSSEGGMRPAWSGDGRTLFFRSRDRICAVDVSPGPVISRARVVLSALPDTRFDAAADGTRFIMGRTPGGSEPQRRINVVEHWWAGAKGSGE